MFESWLPSKRPKQNPTAPVWTGGVCTLQVEILSDMTIEGVKAKANAFASDKMAAGIDIRKDKDVSSSGQFKQQAGLTRDVWYAQVNYWVVLQ